MKSAIRIVFVSLSMLAVHASGQPTIAQESMPLDSAVAAVNRDVLRYFTDIESHRKESLAKEKWPTPLTVDQVLTAIRQWKPGDNEGEQATLPILQQVAKSSVLPKGSSLYHHDQWIDNDPDDRYEHRVIRYQLDVMTSETTGYGLPILTESIDSRIALRPSEGFVWLLNPRSHTFGSIDGISSGEFAFSVVRGSDGALTVLTTHLLKDAGNHPIIAVAFDGDFQRHEFKGKRIGEVGNTAMTRFEIPPSELPWQQVKYLGFETVAGEGGVRLIAQRAFEQAKAKGIEILPLPEVGKHYGFSLTASNASVINSQSLKGKVLLIDFWATWCGPCMKQMPDLKLLYERWHDRGLEILGISYDDDADAAKKAYARLEIPWSLFVIPGGTDNHELWHKATTITSLPTALLVDQNGVLIAHLQGDEIGQKLEDILQATIAKTQDTKESRKQ